MRKEHGDECRGITNAPTIDQTIQLVTNTLGTPINRAKYEIIDRGVPHQPKSMPLKKMGVYTFWYGDTPMKIGKAGEKSNARFLSQHYKPGSAQSTLAKSVLLDENMKDKGINYDNVGIWIKNNCRRVDIIIDSDEGAFTLELIEAVLHYKYKPIYEGFISQR